MTVLSLNQVVYFRIKFESQSKIDEFKIKRMIVQKDKILWF